MTPKQQKDIESIMFFIPKLKYPTPTEEDIKNFLELSERGLHKELENYLKMDGFNALIQGKRWRGIHIHELWEKEILSGLIPYLTILGKENPKYILPRIVVDFIKKEIFKGYDADLIEYCYQEVLKYWTWWRKLLFKIFN